MNSQGWWVCAGLILLARDCSGEQRFAKLSASSSHVISAELDEVSTKGLSCHTNTGSLCALTQAFISKDNHYTIHYPDNWRVFERGNGLVVFKPKPGDTHLINIQTLLTQRAGGTYPDVKALMDDFYSQVPKHLKHVQFITRSAITLAQPTGELVHGEQTLLTFVEQGVILKQWQVMLLLKNKEVFQAFAYRAPLATFEAERPLAVAMFRSWVID